MSPSWPSTTTYFARLRSATEADPAAGRYEGWVIRVTFERAS
jgi:hypothetical protein